MRCCIMLVVVNYNRTQEQECLAVVLCFIFSLTRMLAHYLSPLLKGNIPAQNKINIWATLLQLMFDYIYVHRERKNCTKTLTKIAKTAVIYHCKNNFITFRVCPNIQNLLLNARLHKSIYILQRVFSRLQLN